MTGSAILRVEATMCRVVLVPLLLMVLSCASGPGPVSDRQWYDQPVDVAWAAAVRAMSDLGADLLVQSRSSGMLAGALDMVELGGRVRIDVTVRSSAGGSGTLVTTSEVSASVRLEDRPADDPQLRDDLAAIRDRFMEALDHHIQALDRMRR
jgi:hypothetical protein